MRFVDSESTTTASRMDFEFQPVPEPGTFIALSGGLALLFLSRRRK
jgi:hypothetical protein